MVPTVPVVIHGSGILLDGVVPQLPKGVFEEGLMKKYQPKQYWEGRGHWLEDPERPKYEGREELPTLAAWVRALEPSSMLEVGSGHGRIYEFLRREGLASPSNFRMCDFVESMLDGCEKRVGIRPDLWDGKRLPYEDYSFDLVISFSVLLHVLEPNLIPVMREHLRVARKAVYIATCTMGIPEGSTGKCRHHDYFGALDVLCQDGEWETSPLRTVIFRGNNGKRDWERVHWVLKRLL